MGFCVCGAFVCFALWANVHVFARTCCHRFALPTRPLTYRELIKAPSVALSEHVFSEMEDKKEPERGFFCFLFCFFNSDLENYGPHFHQILCELKGSCFIWLFTSAHLPVGEELGRVSARFYHTDFPLRASDWLRDGNQQDCKEDFLKIKIHYSMWITAFGHRVLFGFLFFFSESFFL